MMDEAAHAAGVAEANGTAPAATDGPETALPAPGSRPHTAETRRLYAADWAAFAA